MQIVGEGQRRRIGHRAGQHAAQGQVVHLREDPRQNPDRQQRNRRDDNSVANPANPLALRQSVDKVAARFQPHYREEQHNAQLAQGQVGAWRHEPVQLPDTADTPQNQRHDQRPARQTELERYRESGHVEGN
ncbi:hypothetical protein D3C81_1830540 [compost metagenome]